MKKSSHKVGIIVGIIITVLSFIGIETVLALAGIYIYANGGSYYKRYGPSKYWKVVNNEGYCGHLSPKCGPNNMEYLYANQGPALRNYAVWDNIDSDKQNGIHKVFIPRVNATSNRAPYSLVYNGISTYHWFIDQYKYYDAWVQTGKFYGIRSTALDDLSYEGSTKKIGFDEVQIGY